MVVADAQREGSVLTDFLALSTVPAPLVVIADDDDDFRELLAGELRRQGLRVRAVDNGRELLAAVATIDLRVEVPDLVITDNRMPGYDGLEVLELLRRIDSPVPVIFFTGFVDAGTLEQAQALGAAAVLAKPFDLEELRRAIEACLERDVAPGD